MNVHRLSKAIYSLRVENKVCDNLIDEASRVAPITILSKGIGGHSAE